MKMLPLILFVLMSCDMAVEGTKPKRVIPVKPFYVFDIGSHGAGSGHHWYKAIDKNGHEFQFIDIENKYSIGDSIK